VQRGGHRGPCECEEVGGEGGGVCVSGGNELCFLFSWVWEGF
jgi:hypothetical protein